MGNLISNLKNLAEGIEDVVIIGLVIGGSIVTLWLGYEIYIWFNDEKSLGGKIKDLIIKLIDVLVVLLDVGNDIGDEISGDIKDPVQGLDDIFGLGMVSAARKKIASNKKQNPNSS